jgi:hypothetical protein
MKIGVCGIACEICPRMKSGICPSGESGCKPKENRFCAVSTCAYRKELNHCFECQSFPCDTTKHGPIAYDYCRYISGKD